MQVKSLFALLFTVVAAHADPGPLVAKQSCEIRHLSDKSLLEAWTMPQHPSPSNIAAYMR